jgi:glyoxylase-like metal-dependent hydrolase (beta-lactamase superfamily II)
VAEKYGKVPQDKKMVKPNLRFFLIIFFLFFNPCQTDEVEDELPLLKVSDNIYVISGDGGNVSFLVTEEGVLVIDCKMFPYQGEDIVSRIKHITPNEIKYLVYTHFHGDHTQGAQAFPPSTLIISQTNTRRNMEQLGLSRIKADKAQHFPRQLQQIQLKIERLKANKNPKWEDAEKELQILKKRIKDYDRLKLIFPHITVEKNASIYLGESEVELMCLGEAHTNGDLLVYFPEEKTIHMGDTLLYFEKTHSMNISKMMERVNCMSDGEIKDLIQFIENWIKVLEIVAERESITTYIPGHGDIMDRSCFLVQWGYLRNLRTEVFKYYLKRESKILWGE